jgi:hypothetical protein
LFVRVAQALREHVQLPQQHGIAVRLTFQELVEKAIRDALAAAPGSEQSWTVLRQAGVQQTPGLTRLVDSLGTAAQTLQSIETEMLNLAASADLDAKAPELLRRYAQARHQRHQLLEEVVSTAGSTGPR